MDIERIRGAARTARNVVVLTGAGVSAESGVPTFRGGGGAAVWRGMDATQLSSAQMVGENLSLVWEWFEYRRGVLKDCQPNPAHVALSDWQDRFQRFTLVTQNIDGLHTRAGSRDVLELHGNIWRGRCTACRATQELTQTPLPVVPPTCAVCHAALRPDVVLFGEYLPVDVFERAVEATVEADLFFVIGTSSVVYPAAELPGCAAHNKAFIVEINPEPSLTHTWVSCQIAGKAGEVLPLIFGA